MGYLLATCRWNQVMTLIPCVQILKLNHFSIHLINKELHDLLMLNWSNLSHRDARLWLPNKYTFFSLFYRNSWLEVDFFIVMHSVNGNPGLLSKFWPNFIFLKCFIIHCNTLLINSQEACFVKIIFQRSIFWSNLLIFSE